MSINVASIADLLANIGDATAHTLTSIVTKLGDMRMSLAVGKSEIFEKAISSAANAGDVTVATVTTQPCLIEGVVIHAITAQTANMTSCGVFGGTSKVITFISATDAVLASLNAIDKQVAWDGKVRLAATKTIVITLAGTGAAAVDLVISIKYRPAGAGGYLA